MKKVVEFIRENEPIFIVGGIVVLTLLIVFKYNNYQNQEVTIQTYDYMGKVEDVEATIVGKTSRLPYKQTRKFYFNIEFDDGYTIKERVSRSEYKEYEEGDKYVASHPSKIIITLKDADGKELNYDYVGTTVKQKDDLNSKIGKKYKYKEVKEFVKVKGW